MTVFSIEIKRVRKLNRRTKLDHSRQLAYSLEFEGIERGIREMNKNRHQKRILKKLRKPDPRTLALLEIKSKTAGPPQSMRAIKLNDRVLSLINAFRDKQ